MIKISLYLFLLCSSLQGLAQPFGEDPRFRYFLRSRLPQFTWQENEGLGKLFLAQHLPQTWIKQLRLGPPSENLDAHFGDLRLDLRDQPAGQQLHLAPSLSSLGEFQHDLYANWYDAPLQVQIFLNTQLNRHKVDRNADQWLDLPLSQRIAFRSIWTVFAPRYLSKTSIDIFNLRAQDGQTPFVPRLHSGSTLFYGSVQAAQHLALSSKHQMNLAQTNEHTDLLSMELVLNTHEHQASYGLRNYQGNEWRVALRPRFTHKIENGQNLFHFGLAYEYHRIEEQLDSLRLGRIASFGGAYLGYSTKPLKGLKLSLQTHIQYHNLAGLLLLPQLHLDYELGRTAFSLEAGRSSRYANLLSEYQNFWMSNRQALIQGDYTKPEQAWFIGLGTQVQVFKPLYQTLKLFWQIRGQWTQFQGLWLPNWEADPQLLRFEWRSRSAPRYWLQQGLSLQGNWPALALDLDLFYLWEHWLVQDGRPNILRPSHGLSPRLSLRPRWYYAAQEDLYKAYEPLELSLTWQVLSPQRLPDNAQGYPLSSPWVQRLDAQLRWDLHHFWSNNKQRPKANRFLLSLILGLDNLGNHRQNLPYWTAQQPFSSSFDAGMVWNSFMPRRWYFGLKWGWD